LGNFSSLTLTGPRWSYEYEAVGFSFKYPPQHRIAEVSQEVIEMQIAYRLGESEVPRWKHRSVVMSVSFVVTEYAPEEGFTLGKQINMDTRNGSRLDFDQLLPFVPGLNVRLPLAR
jgi:hypothetical protein